MTEHIHVRCLKYWPSRMIFCRELYFEGIIPLTAQMRPPLELCLLWWTLRLLRVTRVERSWVYFLRFEIGPLRYLCHGYAFRSLQTLLAHQITFAASDLVFQTSCRRLRIVVGKV